MALGMVLAGAIALAAVVAGLDNRAADAAQPAPAPWVSAAAGADAAQPARTNAAPVATGGTGAAWPAAAAPARAAVQPAPPAPAPQADPTAALAQAVPQPVPLARAQRDPNATARLDAAAAAAPPVRNTLQVQGSQGQGQGQVHGVDAAGRPVRAELAQASIDEVALGLRYLPGSQAVTGSGRRVPDGAGGEAVSVQLMGSGTLETATQYYQAQLATPGMPPGSVQVQQPAPGQVLLHARDPRSGIERTVWIVRNGDQLGIVLARARQGQNQTP